MAQLLHHNPSSALEWLHELVDLHGARLESESLRETSASHGDAPSTPPTASPAVESQARLQLLQRYAEALLGPLTTAAHQHFSAQTSAFGRPPDQVAGLGFETLSLTEAPFSGATASAEWVSSLLDLLALLLNRCPCTCLELGCAGGLVGLAATAVANASLFEASVAVSGLRAVEALFSLQERLQHKLAADGHRHAQLASAVQHHLQSHGPAVVRVLTHGVCGQAPEFLVQPFGSALAGLLGSQPESTAAAVLALSSELALHFPSPAVAETAVRLMCRCPPLSYTTLRLLFVDVWSVATGKAEPQVLERYR